MDTTLQSANPEVGTPANPQGEPGTPTDGTTNIDGQASGQTDPVDENLGGIDPKSLPPELKGIYTQMLRDYKNKTTGISERVKSEVEKEIEGYKQKAEFYDQFVSHDELVKFYNDYANKMQQTDAQQENDPIRQEIQQIKTELQTSKALEAVNAFAEAKNEQGELLHPDFNTLSAVKIGDHAQDGEYSLLRASVELASGKDTFEKLENGYKMAKAVYDSIFEEGRKAGMGRLQQKLKNGSLSPSSSISSAQATRRPKNALEALEFARQGLAPNAG